MKICEHTRLTDLEPTDESAEITREQHVCPDCKKLCAVRFQKLHGFNLPDRWHAWVENESPSP